VRKAAKGPELSGLLKFMLRAIERVREDVASVSKDVFLADDRNGRRLRDAVVLNIGHIGEIAHDIEKRFTRFAAENPDLPLRLAYEMRNNLFHGYHAIDYEIVWTTSRRSIPALERKIRSHLARLDVADKRRKKERE